MYGKLKADVREIIKRLCDYRNIEIIEGAVCADHVHLCLSIPPSEKVSDVIAYIKGKSALMIHDKYPEMVNGWSKSFWARGYYVATVGNIIEEAVKEYIQQQKCHNFTITIIYKIRFIVILWANRTFKMF